MRKVMVIVTVLGIGAASVLARSDFGGKQRNYDRGPGGAKIMKLLDNPKLVESVGLTDEDIASMKQKAYELQKKMVSLRATKELADIQLNHLMQQSDADKEAVSTAVEAAGAAATALRKATVMHQLEMRELLGAEKLEKLKAAGEKFRKKMKKRHGGSKDGKFGKRGSKQGRGQGQRPGGPAPDAE